MTQSAATQVVQLFSGICSNDLLENFITTKSGEPKSFEIFILMYHDLVYLQMFVQKRSLKG